MRHHLAWAVLSEPVVLEPKALLPWAVLNSGCLFRLIPLRGVIGTRGIRGEEPEPVAVF